MQLSGFTDRTNHAMKVGTSEVHVWRAYLNGIDKRSLDGLLSADELARAEKFYFSKDRDYFIAGRGLLRRILGQYLDRPANKLCFRYNVHGKPSLDDSYGSDLRFNVSHSNDIALYAITTGREVGVDVEYIRPIATEDSIAEQFFSSREIAELRSLPPHLQQMAFYTCWTRKEAYIKATGTGLALDLHQFDVSLKPGEPVALLRVNGDPDEVTRWTMRELVPAQDYVGALVVEGNDWQLKCRQWEDSYG